MLQVNTILKLISINRCIANVTSCDSKLKEKVTSTLPHCMQYPTTQANEETALSLTCFQVVMCKASCFNVLTSPRQVDIFSPDSLQLQQQGWSDRTLDVFASEASSRITHHLALPRVGPRWQLSQCERKGNSECPSTTQLRLHDTCRQTC